MAAEAVTDGHVTSDKAGTSEELISEPRAKQAAGDGAGSQGLTRRSSALLDVEDERGVHAARGPGGRDAGGGRQDGGGANLGADWPESPIIPAQESPAQSIANLLSSAWGSSDAPTGAGAGSNSPFAGGLKGSPQSAHSRAPVQGSAPANVRRASRSSSAAVVVGPVPTASGGLSAAGDEVEAGGSMSAGRWTAEMRSADNSGKSRRSALSADHSGSSKNSRGNKEEYFNSGREGEAVSDRERGCEDDRRAMEGLSFVGGFEEQIRASGGGGHSKASARRHYGRIYINVFQVDNAPGMLVTAFVLAAGCFRTTW